MKSMYNTPSKWIIITPSMEVKNMRLKSGFVFKIVPAKNTAGMNAKIYPKPYSKR